MKPDRRRELLRRLEEAAKADGKVSTRHFQILACEALRELLMDSVYIEVPVAPEMSESDETEVPVARG